MEENPNSDSEFLLPELSAGIFRFLPMFRSGTFKTWTSIDSNCSERDQQKHNDDGHWATELKSYIAKRCPRFFLPRKVEEKKEVTKGDQGE